MSQPTIVDPRTFAQLVRDGAVCECCGAWGVDRIQTHGTCCSARCSAELLERKATTARIRADALARYGSEAAWLDAMSRAFMGTE